MDKKSSDKSHRGDRRSKGSGSGRSRGRRKPAKHATTPPSQDGTSQSGTPATAGQTRLEAKQSKSHSDGRRSARSGRAKRSAASGEGRVAGSRRRLDGDRSARGGRESGASGARATGKSGRGGAGTSSSSSPSAKIASKSSPPAAKPKSRSAKQRYKDLRRLEKKFTTALAQPVGETDEAQLVSQQVAIRKKFERLIFDDIEYALEHDLVQSLWKVCYYKVIERYRLQIRQAVKVAPDRRVKTMRAVVNAFHEFCDESTGFFQHLLKRLARRRRRLEGKSSGSDGESHKDDSLTERLTWTCHRCLIFLGDLARYKVLHTDTPQRDWTIATQYYSQANVLVPASGNPHNQLAVLATYSDAACLAIYRYCRSLLVPQPFLTARENLVVLYEKNRLGFLKMLESPIVSRIESAGPQALFRNPQLRIPTQEWLLVRVVRCSGMLFTGVDLERVPDLIRGIGRDTGRLLRVQSITPDLLLQILVIGMFGVRNAEWYPEGHVRTEADDRRRTIVKSYAMLALLSFASNMCKHLSASLKAPASRESPGSGKSPVDSGASTTAHGHGDKPGSTIADNPMVSLLAPIGVMCDWMRVHPHLWTAPSMSGGDVRSESAKRGRRGGRGRQDAAATQYADVAALESVLRGQLIGSLVELENALIDAGAVPSAKSGKTEDRSDGSSFEGDGFVRRTLPEEVELRGFEPLRGMYDNLALPHTTREANDLAVSKGAAVPSVFADAHATVAARLAVVHNRAAKILAVVSVAAEHAVTTRVVAAETPTDGGPVRHRVMPVTELAARHTAAAGVGTAPVSAATEAAVYKSHAASFDAPRHMPGLYVPASGATPTGIPAGYMPDPASIQGPYGMGISFHGMPATPPFGEQAGHHSGPFAGVHVSRWNAGLSASSAPYVPGGGSGPTHHVIHDHMERSHGSSYAGEYHTGPRVSGGVSEPAVGDPSWASLPLPLGSRVSVESSVHHNGAATTTTTAPATGFGWPEREGSSMHETPDSLVFRPTFGNGDAAADVAGTPASVVAAALGDTSAPRGHDGDGLGGFGGAAFALPGGDRGIWQRESGASAASAPALPFSFASGVGGGASSTAGMADSRDLGGDYWGGSTHVGGQLHSGGSSFQEPIRRHDGPAAGPFGTAPAGDGSASGSRPWSSNPFI